MHPTAPTATHAQGREEERRREEGGKRKRERKKKRKREKEISSVRKKIVTEVEWGYSAMCAVMA